MLRHNSRRDPHISLGLMDPLSAVVELVKALAWPVSVFAIILLLRRPIQGLISSIREGSVKYKDLEFSFKRDLEEARQSIKLPEGQAARALPAPQEPEITDLMALAETAPRAAVIEAWARLEVASAEWVQKHAPPDVRTQLKPHAMFRELLRQQGLLPPGAMKALQKLRDIRNRTVHTPEFQPSVDDAEEYVLLSFAVIEDLQRT
jgi:hypothetical protein